MNVDRMESKCDPKKKTLTQLQSEKNLSYLSLKRSTDTCSPGKNKTLQVYRVYTILIPVVLAIFLLELIFILIFIPDTLGSSLTLKGSLPDLSSIVKK